MPVSADKKYSRNCREAKSRETANKSKMHINNHKNVSLSDRQKLWGLIGGCGKIRGLLFRFQKICTNGLGSTPIAL